MSWPPTLDELKPDMGIAADDTRDDAALARMLAAAVAFVERVRPGFDYEQDPLVNLPAPTNDLFLGTLRLAARWHTRRRSPDGLVQMAELGSSRVPNFDPDIDRLLGIGKYRAPVIA